MKAMIADWFRAGSASADGGDVPIDPVRRSLAASLPFGLLAGWSLPDQAALASPAPSGRRFQDDTLIDLGDAEARFKALFRLERDLRDESIALSSYQFITYGVPLGTRPQPVVRWEGMEFSYFRRVGEWTWRIHAHNVSYPRDLTTGAFVDSVVNPFTGERLELKPMVLLEDPGVLHGPKGYLPLDSSRPAWLKTFHVVRGEGDLLKSEHVRPTPEGWPSLFIESSCSTVTRRDFFDPAVTAIPYQTSGFYAFPFPAWMRMGSTPGLMIGAWSGRRVVDGVEDLPREFADRVHREYPALLSPRWGELASPLSAVAREALTS